MESRVGVRHAAIRILREAMPHARFVDEVLAEEIGNFESRDRRLLQEITYGCARHQNTLDRVLAPYLKLPVRRQRPLLRLGLRVGAYQVVYLLRIPAHAAVNQTLEALKAFEGVGKGDVGFVNAVLHRLVADIRFKKDEAPLENDDPTVIPIRQGYCYFNRPVLPLLRLEPIEHLSIRHSHPGWLVERWLGRFGEEETRGLLEANNRVPRPTVRVTRKAPSRDAAMERLASEGFEVEAGPRQDAIVLVKGEDMGKSGVLADGWIVAQDITPMEIASMLEPPEGSRVLDLCSAPGGKAAWLLERAGETGHVVAADRSEERLALLAQTLSRIGSAFTRVTLPAEPEEIDLGETFTHVLVDAPCTNTGVLARRPDARWRLGRKDLESLVELQSRLLEAAFRHLRPGGRLLYSTCSIEPEENEERVARLTADHPEMTEIRAKLFLPHRVEGDGGFASLLIRERPRVAP